MGKNAVETTAAIANTIGDGRIMGQLLEGLENESESFCRMVVDAVQKIVVEIGGVVF